MSIDEWRALRAEVKRGNPYREPHALAPPQAFRHEGSRAAIRRQYVHDDDPDRVGRASRTVARRITRSCCGWKTRPNSEEFYEALRARQPNQRQRNLINMWWQEATNDELILAWAEDVYSIRELVAAIHAAEAQDDYPERNAEVNGFADH